MFQRHDEGFSLVEVLIAMFLFAVISLAVLPLLISGLSLSVVNKEGVAATTLANDRLAQLRDQFPTARDSARTCEALVIALRDMDVDDASNPGLRVAAAAFPEDPDAANDTNNPDSQICPVQIAQYPRAVVVVVTVSEGTTQLARVPTRITVGAEK